MPKIIKTHLINDSYRSGLRFAKRTYFPRIIGCSMASICVAPVIATHPTPLAIWVLLFLNGFIWPHIASQLAIHTSNPFQAEIRNLQIDVIFGGAWLAVMGFNALPSAVIVAMVGMNNIAAGGKTLFFKCLALQAIVAMGVFLLGDLPLQLETSPLQLYLCLPMIVIYPIFLGNVTYHTSLKLAKHKQAIMQISVRDGLTGLYNRRHWESLLDNEIESFQRYHHKTTLVLIDIDHFKEINDNYGHSVGDQAIILLAQELQQTLRAADIIGRYGGDEFAAILPHTTAEQTQKVLERLQSRLDNDLFPQHPELRVRISAGIAECKETQESAAQWLNAADTALYKAKNGGRNRIAERE